MAATKLRASRFRLSDVDTLLPPPLPLIDIPDEVRLARTGVPGLRPTHLPVRHHIIESHANISSSGNTVVKPAREPEPILRESRVLVEREAEEDEAREIVARVHVYEYNEPAVSPSSDTHTGDDTLVFDSLFESGNLQRAERIYRRDHTSASSKQQEYELLIHPDIKNSAYRQWFYFEVRNGRPGVRYKFALTNLAKSGALFGSGLQPVVYSDIDAETKGVGWTHRGTHVRYDASLAADSAPGSTCLRFQYEFEHEHDRVYFACLQPYTYTDLIEYLEALERDPERAAVCRRTELCQSIAQNPCDLLTITSPGKDGIPTDEKRVVVLSARVHPGEPNSSWMMKGMIDYLTGPSSGAHVLRQHVVFKVVPMLNPDGVINGNTRVNLAGSDLNRKWSSPVEKLFPTVFHLKRQLATLQARDRVAIYCDLHGHSLNRNIFTYGCYTGRSSKRSSSKRAAHSSSISGTSSSSTSLVNSTTLPSRVAANVKNDPRVFPMIVARHARFFSFASCDFRVHASKVTTARVVVHHELGVVNSYTLEASFCGPDNGPRKDTQFATWDLEEMGQAWCESLLIYFGLVGDVRAFNAQIQQQLQRCGMQTTTGLQQQHGPIVAGAAGPDSSALLTASTPTAEIASSLLRDCEAAVSALSANGGGTDLDDDDAVDIAFMDSDVSGAEDEPILANDTNGSSNEQLFQRSSGARDEPVDGYSSAPEDSELLVFEQDRDGGADGSGCGRRKSRGASCKVAKKGSKRSKPARAKNDKTCVRSDPAVDFVVEADDSSVAAIDLVGQEPIASDPAAPTTTTTTTKAKKKKTGAKHRRKSKTSKNERRAKSSSSHTKRLLLPIATTASDDSDNDNDAAEPTDAALLAIPLSSARANAEVVVLPIVPGSGGRRRLASASQAGASSVEQQQQQPFDYDDSSTTNSREFVCPTPPRHLGGRSKVCRTGSPLPIELPLVRPLPVQRRDSGSNGVNEPHGLVRTRDHYSHPGDNDNVYDSKGASDSRRYDDDTAQFGPESYRSES